MNLKNHFGLDVGTSSLKLVQLSSEGNTIKLETVAQAPAASEINLTQINTDLTPLSDSIKNLVKLSHVTTKYVCISLPESQIYTRIINMPVMSDVELNQAIKFQIEQYVPLPADEMTEKHSVISRPEIGKASQNKTEMEVLLVATPNFLVERYVQMMEKSGLEVVAIDTEILASSRALVGANVHSPTTLLVNMGSKGTDFAVVKHGDLLSTRSIGTGGMAIARAVASELNLDIVQAEEYKKNYGLDSSQLSGSVVKAVSPMMDLIVTEIKRILGNVETSHPEDPVKRIVLCGGTALLPGVVGYLAAQFNIEVEVGNPFADIKKTEEQIKIIGESGAVYSNAVGLALKQI